MLSIYESKRSFTFVTICVKNSFLYLLFSIPFIVPAQQRIEGIAFDVDTKQRIGKVLVINSHTKANVFNNSKGEFGIQAKAGDMLIASKENYFGDTVVYEGQKVLLFYLKKASIYIDPVHIRGNKSPDEILAQQRKDYDKAYKLADPGSLFSVGQGGAGLSINAVYNLLSKEGRNARRLTKFIQRDYEENSIDMRFTKELITNITGLKGIVLENFMLRYRPTYSFVTMASTYQMTEYIKIKYDLFKLNPNFKPLPQLPKFPIDEY